MTKQSAPWQERVIDPLDPLWFSISNLTVGQTPEQASKTLMEFVESLPKQDK
jgi:hypothetical protein